MTTARRRSATLAAGERLGDLYRSFDHVTSATDPVHIVRRYEAAADREVVGFCAAALAFGRVASVLQSIESLLAVMGPRPAEFVRHFDPVRERPRFAPLVHRWIGGRDLLALLIVLQRMLREAGSIEAFFSEGDDPGSPDIGPALDSFSARALTADMGAAYGRRVPRQRGVSYFFPRPSAGSACKRLNLFLRWMVRHDAIDLGVWSAVSPSRLIVPLDTHVIRLGRCLRLTRRTSPGWKMAADITAALRAFDPQDPVRFDFALCHVGMMNACGFLKPQGSAQCPLRGLCSPKVKGQTSKVKGKVKGKVKA
jgi:uncharacterized protein (TIGR02757 family)